MCRSSASVMLQCGAWTSDQCPEWCRFLGRHARMFEWRGTLPGVGEALKREIAGLGLVGRLLLWGFGLWVCRDQSALQSQSEICIPQLWPSFGQWTSPIKRHQKHRIGSLFRRHCHLITGNVGEQLQRVLKNLAKTQRNLIMIQWVKWLRIVSLIWKMQLLLM